MELLLNAPLSKLPPLPKICATKRKPLGARLPSCLGVERHDDMDVHKDLPQSMDHEPKEKQNDIWQLFTEAQQNILYLNKQRLTALEELDELKRENTALLDRIEQLEAKMLLNTEKEMDTLSISSELLLRIDSMVLSGMIDNAEASDLRRLVMNSRMSIAANLFQNTHKKDSELLVELRHFSSKSKKKGFHIVHISAEMAPVVSVGSLASYVTGLSCALQRKGHVVEVILPKYACLNLDEVQGLREVEAEVYSFFNGQLHKNRIWTGVVFGIGVTFIQPVYYSAFFSHERVYGYGNDFERFTYFSRASLDYLVKSGKKPDIVHIHNWETSIVGPLFWDVFVNQGLEGTRILLTCQGFDSQCLQRPEKLALCGLDPSRLHRPDRLQDNNKTHMVNILKGGVVYSNKVIVIASMQTKAHLITELGHGMEPTLAIHKDKLLIAPYGFDKSVWDPSVDKFLPESYSEEDMKGKSVCKISLQKHLGLTKNASMILKFQMFTWRTSRLLFGWLPEREFSQNPDLRREVESLLLELKDGNVKFIDKYDEPLLHLILAGCDIILCPSFDDPELQVPLKAIKYGAGLVALNFTDDKFGNFADHDFGRPEVSKYIRNSFGNMSLSQAINEIEEDPSQWNRKITDAMAKDFSWDAECCDIHVSAYAAIKNL
ncbi:probable starch synthase 4, chloroplastic/amyloplastic isoform X2 [Coffea eugenioides]|uniref:starch synthase n=1 Tax=Coffea arabica TaxID=13443 RepID=A0A6P6TLD9_COFAR|nr:probable starch synthase 4, chloroplastic/amyloplastic isoform X2 [Coffea arabica]XP_027178693.1 probable starch synthase 4, chloroplastic/amyloplastic isoform X2 [Coffea eugenioides]